MLVMFGTFLFCGVDLWPSLTLSILRIVLVKVGLVLAGTSVTSAGSVPEVEGLAVHAV